MCRDALNREESCGGHFREEYQTEEGEGKRNDSKSVMVSARNTKGKPKPIDKFSKKNWFMKISNPQKGVTNNMSSINIKTKV